MNQMTNQKAFLAAVAIFAIPLFLMMLLGSMISSLSIKGSISFQNIEGAFSLEDTSYVLVYTDHNLVLRNRFTGKSVDIVRNYSPVATPPAYARVQVGLYQTYLITRLASGGNTGAYWFRVFDLTHFPIVELTSEDHAPENGLSCLDPRLDEHRFPNQLIFERSTNCAASPAVYQEYTLPLLEQR